MKWLKKQKRWQVRWYVTVKMGVDVGRVIKGSKCFRHKEAATAFRAEVERQADYLAAGLAQPEELLVDAVEKWYKSIREFTDRTQYLYRMVMALFIRHLPKNIRVISQLKPIHIRDYLDRMLDNGRTNRTCNAHLTVIKSFCRWLNDSYEIPNPARKIKMLKEAPPKQRFLTNEEYQKTLPAGDYKYLRWAQFIANTGLRASEFCRLTWDCIDENLTSFTIEGKGRKRRTLPLNETSQQILRELFDTSTHKSGFVFRFRGKPLKRRQLLDRCKQTAKKANVSDFGPHALRHFFATRLLLNGTHVSIVSKLLGHASVKTTEQTYIHILPEHLTGTTDCLS